MMRFFMASPQSFGTNRTGGACWRTRSDPSWPMGGAKCIGSHKTSQVYILLNIDTTSLKVVWVSLHSKIRKKGAPNLGSQIHCLLLQDKINYFDFFMSSRTALQKLWSEGALFFPFLGTLCGVDTALQLYDCIRYQYTHKWYFKNRITAAVQKT